MDEALAFAIIVVAPGLLLILLGGSIRLRAIVSSHRDSRTGTRLTLVGFMVIYLVPGVAILAEVVMGKLIWLALVAAVLPLALAAGFARFAQRHWGAPGSKAA